VKRLALIRRVEEASRRAGLNWVLLRQGGGHEIWRLEQTMVAIPRHRELKEQTALSVFRKLEPELGKDWWR
jgi:hypothetical protein